MKAIQPSIMPPLRMCNFFVDEEEFRRRCNGRRPTTCDECGDLIGPNETFYVVPGVAGDGGVFGVHGHAQGCGARYDAARDRAFVAAVRSYGRLIRARDHNTILRIETQESADIAAYLGDNATADLVLNSVFLAILDA